jgi:RNA polymerase sigma factor (sigma-70 family)
VLSWQQHIPIAESMAARFARRLASFMSPEDILQAALIGLWEACRKHDGVTAFVPYARRIIKYRIFDELRHYDWGTRRHHVSVARFGDLAPSAEDDMRAEGLGPEHDASAREEAQLAFAAALPLRARLMLLEHFVDDTPVGEIARNHGVSQGRVSQIVGRSLDVMRAHLTGNSPRPLAKCGAPC